jgi:hypothetical protein
MSLVILQPAGNQGGREHYVDTIEKLVKIEECKPYVPLQIFENLAAANPTGEAGMWGVVSGKNNVNVNKWAKISVGDLVLFAANKKIHSSGIVSYKFNSINLAEHLWGLNQDGYTWEYMYSLDEIKSLNITYEEFNEIVGYKTNNIIQGFTVLDREKSSAFFDHFALRSERHIEDVSEEEFEEAILGLDGELDRKATSWHRKEQSRGRKRLLKGRAEGYCQLCGKKMLAEFLIAAHIKRRTDCTDEEKRDLDGVMMLACKFGCDYLFEVGFITVDETLKLKISPKLSDQTALNYVSQMSGRTITVTQKQEKYFKWHHKNRFVA